MQNTEENLALYSKNEAEIEIKSRSSTLEKRWSFWLLTTGIVTTFGASIPVGYNIGVINSPAQYIKEWCNNTIYEEYGSAFSVTWLETFWSSVVAIFLIGGMVGSLGGAYVADKLGRKRSFLLCGIFLTTSAICFQFCRNVHSVELLLLGRLIAGFAAGLTTSTVPMYLTELAPLELRGTMGVLCSMGITGGVVVGQVVSLQEVFGTEDQWQYALSSYCVLVIISFILYPWLPESPKYLYSIKNNHIRAIKEIQCLRGKHLTTEYIENEIFKKEDTASNDCETMSILSVLKDPKLRLPLILVCCLQGGQQLSGINAVFYYSVSMFEAVGLTSQQAKFANLGAGSLNLFVAFFSPILMAKYNRRFLSILSCSMCSVFLFILTFSTFYKDITYWVAHIAIASIFLYILFYQIGLGPIPFFIGSELFDVKPRPAAMSMGSLASWSCNFVVGMLFPILNIYWGAFVFIPFCINCVFLTILLKRYLPETRGKNPSEIAPLIAQGFRSKPYT